MNCFRHFLFLLRIIGKFNCTNVKQTTTKKRQSGDGTVTSPTSHVITVSVCSHWFLSHSEPAGCESLAHNETGKTRALVSHWSADGRHRGISSVLQSAAPELAWVSVSVWFCIYSGSPLAAIKVASTLPGVHTQFSSILTFAWTSTWEI